MIGCYCRQSIEKKDSLSIDSQLQLIHNFCTARSWEWQDYVDRGYSGKSLNRPGFQALLKDVRSGKVDKIVCYRLDRISRNIAEFSNLILELQEYHCEFVSITENFDTSTPIGRAMIMICMVFAQMERETISDRVRDNYYYRSKLGFWGGGMAPYGYRLARTTYHGQNHTVLEIAPEQARVVQQIYDWYLEPGTGIRQILHRLNCELKIPSPKGTQWTSRVVADLLEKPLYAPNDMTVYRYLKAEGANILNPPEEFDGTAAVDLYGMTEIGAGRQHKRCRNISDMYCNIRRHPAIIDSAVWVQAAQKRAQAKKVPRRQGTGQNSPFTGLLRCQECGHSVSILHGHGGDYYVCSSRKNRGRDACSLPMLRQDRIDSGIFQGIREHLDNPEIRQQIMDLAAGKKPQTAADTSRRNQLLAEMETIDSQIQNLMDALASGSATTMKYINQKLEELDRHRADLEKQIADMDQADTDPAAALAQYLAGILDRVDEIIEGGEFDAKKSLAHSLIRKISFDKEGEIEVEYWI